MDILNFLLHENQIIFSSALFILLFILFIESILFMVGASSDAIFNQSFIIDELTWLNKEKIPFVIIMTLVLGVFSTIGLVIQSMFDSIFEPYLLSVVVALITLFIVKYLSVFISKVLPKDETSIISEDSFIGMVGTVVIGKGNRTSDVEFKVVDKLNRNHYIMGYVTDGELNQGEQGLIIKRKKNGKFILSVKII